MATETKQLPPTEDEILELKAKNPGATLRLWNHEDVLDGRFFVYKVPKDAPWKMFQTQRANDESAPYALRTLVLQHIVKPTPTEFMVLLDEAPGLVESLGNKMVKAAGATNAGSDRKL